MRCFLLALSLFVAACTTGTGLRPADPWPAAVREFSSAAEIGAAAARFPNSAGMQRRMLAAALQSGDGVAALEAARRLAAMGAVLSTAVERQLAALVGTEAGRALGARFAANAEPVAASSLRASIPVAHRLVEGIAWDPGRRRLLVTTVVGGSLVSVDERGAGAIAWPAGPLVGAAFDRRRRRLWIAAAELDLRPPDRPAFSGLLSIDPDAPGRATRIPAPPGAYPGDVAVASDGTVYASDGLNGAVYRCRPGCATLETWLAAGTFFSAQSLAVSADRRLLYVADRRYGLAAVERTSGRVFRVAAPPETMLDGIDGLVAWRGELIATQTAYPPSRIVRLRLAPGGLAITRLDVIERAHPEWGEVTLATVAGDTLLYVADAQWDSWGPGGVAAGTRPPRPTPIRSLRLR